MIETQGEDFRLWNFESTAELADVCEARDWLNGQRKGGRGGAWYGGTVEHVLNVARRGDDSAVGQAEALIEQLSVALPEAERRDWQAAPCGAFPVIPEVLAGMPTPMRNRVRVNDDRAPVRIFVDLTTSAGIGADDMRKRGIAALALAMQTCGRRPTEVYTVSAEGGSGKRAYIVVVRIPSQPLELSTACAAMTEIGLCRMLGYGVHMANGSNGSWAWSMDPMGTAGRKSYSDKMRAALGMTEKDVFCPPAYFDDEMIRRPVEWINARLKEVNQDPDA